MKSITKLRLINWHYFTNICADIKNITFLTGPNGTGKSTIIDALQIIILGTTRPDNFNKAANEKGRSGRNLLSYLRGQTGVKDDGSVIVLREGTFTSYIAIELYDDVKDSYFTLGACFDVDSSDKIDKHYFYLDSKFPENNFTNSDTETNKNKIRGMMYKELSSFVKENYKTGHYKFMDTDNDYQVFIKEAFGNLPDKYFSLFKKAVSFAPISNISSFITEYICDAEKNIDIAPMQKNIEQYKILEHDAKNLKIKVDDLQKIQAAFDEVSNDQRKGDMLNYVNARVKYEENEKKLSILQDKLEKAETRSFVISDQIARLDTQLDDLQKDLESYNAKKLQSDSYSLTEKLELKKDTLTQRIDAIQMQVTNVISTISTYLQSYSAACSQFTTYYKDFNPNQLGEKASQPFQDLDQLCIEISQETAVMLLEIPEHKLDFQSIKTLKADMESLKALSQQVKAVLNERFFEASEQLQSLQNDLVAINSGKKPFEKLGPAYMEIKKALEDALSSRHPDSKVEIYCDLVDSLDPEWNMALEAVLYNQKFNFFVNPKYYEEANRILKELSSTYNYFHVSLVDTERLLADKITADPGSIAELIKTSHKGARVYTDYLLGRIKKCYTFKEARESGSGLLSDCTGYRGYATWYLNKNNARISFLGTKVSDDTKAISSDDYQRVNKTYSKLSEALNKVENLIYLQVMSEAEFNSYEADFKKLDELNYLHEQIDQVDQDIENATKGDMALVMEKVSAINYAIKHLQEQRTDLLKESGQLSAEKERYTKEDIPNLTKSKEETRNVLESFDSEKVNIEYDPFFNKLLDEQHMTLAEIRDQAYRELIQVQNKSTRDKANLTRYRNEYCTRYNLNYDVTNDKTNVEFDKDLETISKVMLPDYEAKINKAHEDSIKEFKDDFIYKLRTAIETVRTQIGELNKALEDSHFGRDSYQFKVSPNKDYQQYYDMIMDPLLFVSGDAENLFMDKYKNTMDSLFELISSSSDASGEQKEQIIKNIELFTNYTTYITFDLLVTRGMGDTKQTISLGRSFTSQSGGETQTPFYISILASFAQLCRVNNATDNDTLRLVIFDEAFSKMDAARIMKSTDLLRQFGLQALLSTPSEKLRDLIGCVDQVLVTMHDDKRKKSYLDTYRDENKKKEDDKKAQQLIEEFKKENPESSEAIDEELEKLKAEPKQEVQVQMKVLDIEPDDIAKSTEIVTKEKRVRQVKDTKKELQMTLENVNSNETNNSNVTKVEDTDNEKVSISEQDSNKEGIVSNANIEIEEKESISISSEDSISLSSEIKTDELNSSEAEKNEKGQEIIDKEYESSNSIDEVQGSIKADNSSTSNEDDLNKDK